MAVVSNNLQSVTEHLVTKGFSPKSAWVTEFLSTQRANIPPQALQSSATFRMIHGDITTSVQANSTNVLPSDIHDGTIKERTVQGPIPVQVLDIEDIGQSRWSQAEAMEAVERGETTRGREIIRVVATENDSDQVHSASSGGPHKLTLQDARGVQIYAIELSPIPNISIGKLMIGSKVILRNVAVARAVILLTPSTATLAGGKIDELHQRWQAGRKQRLRDAARASAAG